MLADPYWEKVAQDAKKIETLRNLAAYPKSDKKFEEKRSRAKKVWICLDCKQESREHWIILNRAARPRCAGCGSIRYEPKTVDAKNDIVSLRNVRKILDGPRGTGNGTFVIDSEL